QAALIAHEALYSVLRELANETSSIRTRRAVGSVFAGFSFRVSSPNLPKSFLRCENVEAHDSLELFLSPGDGAQSRLHVYPRSLDGSPLLGTQAVFALGDPTYEFVASGRCTPKAVQTMLWGNVGVGDIEF